MYNEFVFEDYRYDPARSILYYRGGMHDSMTLGYPSVPGGADRTSRD